LAGRHVAAPPSGKTGNRFADEGTNDELGQAVLPRRQFHGELFKLAEIRGVEPAFCLKLLVESSQ